MTVLIAFFFHRSAFILLILYPFCRFKITANWLWVCIPVIGILFVFKAQIFLALGYFVGDLFTVDVHFLHLVHGLAAARHVLYHAVLWKRISGLAGDQASTRMADRHRRPVCGGSEAHGIAQTDKDRLVCAADAVVAAAADFLFFG